MQDRSDQRLSTIMSCLTSTGTALFVSLSSCLRPIHTLDYSDCRVLCVYVWQWVGCKYICIAWVFVVRRESVVQDTGRLNIQWLTTCCSCRIITVSGMKSIQMFTNHAGFIYHAPERLTGKWKQACCHWSIWVITNWQVKKWKSITPTYTHLFGHLSWVCHVIYTSSSGMHQSWLLNMHILPITK